MYKFRITIISGVFLFEREREITLWLGLLVPPVDPLDEVQSPLQGRVYRGPLREVVSHGPEPVLVRDVPDGEDPAVGGGEAVLSGDLVDLLVGVAETGAAGLLSVGAVVSLEAAKIFSLEREEGRTWDKRVTFEFPAIFLLQWT